MKIKSTLLSLLGAAMVLAACSTTPSDKNGANGNGLMDKDGKQMGQIAPNVADRVFFDYDSSIVKADGQATLQKQADWLNKNMSVNVTIEGHCDERGTREYNLALGERRANAAKKYLVSLGVSAKRIQVISYGKERPAVVGSDESAWAQNRRAVTVIANQ